LFFQASVDERKEMLLNHALTQAPRTESWQGLESRWDASQELFNHNLSLYSWLMANDTAIIADYVLAFFPTFPR